MLARLALSALAAASIAAAMPAGAAPLPQPVTQAQDAAPGSFQLVGHNPLMNRGMNAALAIHGKYAYIGSRTDNKTGQPNVPAEAQGLAHGGVMIVDVSNPAAPTIVKEMLPPDEGNPGESSRELRIWHAQEILIILHTNCSNQIHACGTTNTSGGVKDFRAYDISGAYAANPRLIRTWTPDTHEFFLWENPKNPDRALIFNTGAGSTLSIVDISPLATGGAPVVLGSGSHSAGGGSLHSLSVSNDGTRAFYALLTGGFAVMDVSDFTSGKPSPQIRKITQTRPTWPGPGGHSAIKVWGQDWVAVFDEVYGAAAKALGAHGCPWGWGRMIDISDPTKPVVRAEYKLPENNASFCEPADTRPTATFSAHNPTFTPHVGLVSWHAGGLQAIDLTDPGAPTQLAEYRPTPLAFVVSEDPLLSAGSLERTVVWSYPIIRDGLIYVVDVRNGLYILRYNGPFAGEVNEVTFLEGNSTQGHAQCYDPPLDEEGEPIVPAYCDDRIPV